MYSVSKGSHPCDWQHTVVAALCSTSARSSAVTDKSGVGMRCSRSNARGLLAEGAADIGPGCAFVRCLCPRHVDWITVAASLSVMRLRRCVPDMSGAAAVSATGTLRRRRLGFEGTCLVLLRPAPFLRACRLAGGEEGLWADTPPPVRRCLRVEYPRHAACTTTAAAPSASTRRLPCASCFTGLGAGFYGTRHRRRVYGA